MSSHPLVLLALSLLSNLPSPPFFFPLIPASQRLGMPRGSKLKVLHVKQHKNLELVSDAYWEVYPDILKSLKNRKYAEFKLAFAKETLQAGAVGKSAEDLSDYFDSYVSCRVRCLTRQEIKDYLVDDLFTSLGLSPDQKRSVMNM